MADYSIWANLIEKAWAKMKGNYVGVDGGFLESGIRALTGVPVFTYYVDELTSYTSLWDTLKEAHDLNYLITAATDGTSDTSYNTCGIPMAHAFSVLSVFHIERSDQTHNMLIVRNPWGITKYNRTWSADDT